jgi:hypothetical protein
MGLQRFRTDRGGEVQPGSTGPPKLKFKRLADGSLQPEAAGEETGAAAEAAEHPEAPDDPRSGPPRDVPPAGGL